MSYTLAAVSDEDSGVNAVSHFARLLAPEAVRRLARLRVSRFDAAQPVARELTTDGAIAAIERRWGGDLCGLLNAMTRGELSQLTKREGRSPELRVHAWERGAALERGAHDVGDLQPRPVLLGGHLVVQAPPRGLFPPSAAWPRPIPVAAPAAPPVEEPDSLDELLAAADRAIGVRLGRRGIDKGAWGNRAAKLLGIDERGEQEPDWRGDVEVKTVPIARELTGHWRVVEDPAIAMLGQRVLAKLARTLWLARADVGDGDATIVGWYLLESPHELVRRYLHVRPKGPADTDQKGLYLHKRFFADAGLLATLNGPA